MNQAATEDICCPPFQPEPWQDSEVKWEGKPFVKDKVRCLFYIPLNFGSVMKRNVSLIEAADAKGEDMLTLADTCSPWGIDVYIGVTKDVPGAQMTTLSGSYLTKVFEGHYKEVGGWRKEMEAYAQSKGRNPKKIYAFYTTCPKCAKKYGKNYVVLLAQD